MRTSFVIGLIVMASGLTQSPAYARGFVGNNESQRELMNRLAACEKAQGAGTATASKVPSDERQVRMAVLGALKDPDSAKFGSFTRVNDKACITVNSRNSFGGYGGDRAVLLAKSGEHWLVLSGDDTLDRLVPNYAACVAFINRD